MDENVTRNRDEPNNQQHCPENNELSSKPIQDMPSIWFSRRFFVAVVLFLCFTVSIMLMCSVNIAIVEMTSSKNITIGNKTVIRPPDFPWDSATIGIVSSAWLYGELLSFFASFFVNKIGGSTSCALCMIISGVLTIIQPATLYFSYYLFLANRFLAGCFVSSFFVSIVEIYSRWFPKKERSTLISLCFNGNNVGIAVSYPLFGYIANRWGWQLVYYTVGAVSVILAILCIILVKNRPSQDKRISNKELQYILQGTDDSIRDQNTNHPYKKILLSVPVLALGCAKFAVLWVDVIVTGCLPLYIKDMTGKSTDEVGLISSIPTAFEILLYPVAGTLIDFWKNHTDITFTRMHKIMLSSAYLSAGVFFVAITLSGSFTLSMAFFVLIQISISVMLPVIDTIIVNIAPNDCSVVAGLCKLFASFGTIISRTSIGFMTIHNSIPEWNNCFLLASAVLVLSTVIFVKCGSSETQSWSSSTSLYSAEEEREYLIRK